MVTSHDDESMKETRFLPRLDFSTYCKAVGGRLQSADDRQLPRYQLRHGPIDAFAPSGVTVLSVPQALIIQSYEVIYIGNCSWHRLGNTIYGGTKVFVFWAL